MHKYYDVYDIDMDVGFVARHKLACVRRRSKVFEPMLLRVAEEKKKPVSADPEKPRWDDRNSTFITYAS